MSKKMKSVKENYFKKHDNKWVYYHCNYRNHTSRDLCKRCSSSRSKNTLLHEFKWL